MQGQISRRVKAGTLKEHHRTGRRALQREIQTAFVRRRKKIQDKQFLTAYIKEMRSISSVFNSDMKEFGLKCLDMLKDMPCRMKFSTRKAKVYQDT